MPPKKKAKKEEDNAVPEAAKTVEKPEVAQPSSLPKKEAKTEKTGNQSIAVEGNVQAVSQPSVVEKQPEVANKPADILNKIVPSKEEEPSRIQNLAEKDSNQKIKL